METVKPSLSLAERIIAHARKEIGVQEIPRGSNAGPDVEKYLKAVNLGRGYAWCMAYAYWVVSQACAEAGIKNPMVCTAGVLAQWNQIAPAYKLVKDPKPGDIFIMQIGKISGHTGFVTGVAAGVIATIEGNTNAEGSREGYMVCERHRLIKSIKGFIRIDNGK